MACPTPHRHRIFFPTVMCALILAFSLLQAGTAAAQCSAQGGHPGLQPRPGPSQQTVSADGQTTFVVTPEGHFPAANAFDSGGGSNLLPTVYRNACDGLGREIPNTLPSTPDNPYNLHPDPTVTVIDATSPTDDIDQARRLARAAALEGGQYDPDAVRRIIDVLEGNTVEGRAYSGIPMLHYNASERVGVVEPVYDDQGEVIGGHVEVQQIWFDSHIESDTAFIDPSAVLEVPWTLTYHIDTLHRGRDDFAPALILVDPPEVTGGPRLPLIGMDQTFFPMQEGTRTTFEMRMPPGKYYNLTYHWGWRIHPPRVQVIENATKVIAGRTLVQWESDVFGENPTASEANKLAAIAKIGDLAPAKRMWNAARTMLEIAEQNPPRLRADRGRENRRRARNDPPLRNPSGNRRDGNRQRNPEREAPPAALQQYLAALDEVDAAFFEWTNRNRLPSGFAMAPDADVTLVYLNNQIYGQMRDVVIPADSLFGANQATLDGWDERPRSFTVKLYNGDYFEHGYTNVDFGGSRGWENQFFSSVAVGGGGPWFTFGRFHWWPNAGAAIWPLGVIMVPAAQPAGASGSGSIGEHRVEILLNYDPARRLRIYQFDPLHHSNSIWSIH